MNDTTSRTPGSSSTSRMVELTPRPPRARARLRARSAPAFPHPARNRGADARPASAPPSARLRAEWSSSRHGLLAHARAFEHDPHPRSLTRRGIEVQMPVQRAHRRAHDCEPEPEPFGVAVAAPVEAVEYVLLGFCGHADSGVLDLDVHCSSCRVGPQNNPALRGVFDGVLA